MTQSTTQTRARQRPTVSATGTCRVLAWSGDVEPGLDAESAVILSVRPVKGADADYFVRRLRDRAGKITGYRLDKIVGHGEEAAPCYVVTIYAGWEHPTCSCPDAAYNRCGIGTGL